MINIYQREELREYLRLCEPFYGIFNDSDLNRMIDRIEEILEECSDEEDYYK